MLCMPYPSDIYSLILFLTKVKFSSNDIESILYNINVLIISHDFILTVIISKLDKLCDDAIYETYLQKNEKLPSCSTTWTDALEMN